MVVDNTVNLFQIADVNRLLVLANCPEDSLPTLEALSQNQRRWTVQTVGANSAAGLPGTIDEIGYMIDPNQHTAIIKGYVDNPGRHIRAGQYVTATVQIPPPAGVVEIAVDALVDDGRQSLVFVQPDADKHHFTMRRVHVTHRFDHSVLVRSTPILQGRTTNRPRGGRGPLAQRTPPAGRAQSSWPGRSSSNELCSTSSRGLKRNRPTASPRRNRDLRRTSSRRRSPKPARANRLEFPMADSRSQKRGNEELRRCLHQLPQIYCS